MAIAFRAELATTMRIDSRRREVFGYVELIRRAPDGARALAVDVDDGGIADGAVEHGAHAGSGSLSLALDGCAFAEGEDHAALGFGEW